MIIGIGSDTVEHGVIQKLKWDIDLHLQKRIFSLQELNLYATNSTIAFLAGRFAVKEAVLKCLGLGMEDGVSLTDIQTLKLKNGCPILKVEGETNKIALKMNIDTCHISLSHTSNLSIAFVVAESLKK